jgi:hypothetical protein
VNYNNYAGNVTGWMTQRPRFNGPFRLAPMMIDRLQCNSAGVWVDTVGTQSAPSSVHRDKSGVPKGGNFLYEDTSVIWKKFVWQGRFIDPVDTIGIGGRGNNDINYFVPAGPGFGPW